MIVEKKQCLKWKWWHDDGDLDLPSDEAAAPAGSGLKAFTVDQVEPEITDSITLVHSDLRGKG